MNQIIITSFPLKMKRDKPLSLSDLSAEQRNVIRIRISTGCIQFLVENIGKNDKVHDP